MGRTRKREIPEFERVDVRLKIPKFKRDKLNILSAIRKTTMNNLLESLVDEAISNSIDLKKLESNDSEKKERISLMGIAKGGQPITKEDIESL